MLETLLLYIRGGNQWVAEVANSGGVSYDFLGSDLQAQAASMRGMANAMTQDIVRLSEYINVSVANEQIAADQLFGLTDDVVLNGTQVFMTSAPGVALEDELTAAGFDLLAALA